MPLLQRDKALDLIKWLAIISMVIDHCRFIFPQISILVIIGRLAFPLFCLAIAANVLRATFSPQPMQHNASYLTRLFSFSLISELPYRLLRQDAETLNIMPTLLLGLVICLCIHTPTRQNLWLMLGVTVSALLLDQYLMYGVLGVLLPVTCYIALREQRAFIVFPMLISLLCNMNPEDFSQIPNTQTLLMLLVAFVAPALGIFLLQQTLNFRVYPVRQWGYWFYPVHLLIIYVLTLIPV